MKAPTLLDSQHSLVMGSLHSREDNIAHCYCTLRVEARDVYSATGLQVSLENAPTRTSNEIQVAFCVLRLSLLRFVHYQI
jgi:hypothetical protein